MFNKIREMVICGSAIAFIIGMLIIGGYIDTHYTVQADVYKKEDNSVYLIDGAGYIWEITDRDDLIIGQSVKIKFHNNTTDYTREDDIIESVKVLP